MGPFINYRCPKCNDNQSIIIQAKLWIKITDQGLIDCGGNYQYESSSHAACGACGYDGDVQDFDPTTRDRQLREGVTTHRKVRFNHELLEKRGDEDKLRRYHFTSTGDQRGAYDRTVSATNLLDARSILRAEFPNAVF